MENKFTYLEPSLEKQLKGHRNGITALYFSPNEQQIASSSLDNSVLVYIFCIKTIGSSSTSIHSSGIIHDKGIFVHRLMFCVFFLVMGSTRNYEELQVSRPR